MKKIVILAVVAIFALTAAWSGTQAASPTLATGDVIKAKNSSALYYIGDDKERHVFPSEKVYKSWYGDYSKVKEVSSDSLSDHPLSRVNVTYKPGARLVKLTTDPKVYAVGTSGVLHWVRTEKVAKEIYGEEWSGQVDDMPDQFFTNYEIGEEIADSVEFDIEEEEEAAPQISVNLVDLRAVEEISDHSVYSGGYTITYDLSAIEVGIMGHNATVTMDDIRSGGAEVGTIDIPADVAAKIDAELSHSINMLIGDRSVLGIRKITMTNLDKNSQPSIDGLYTERSRNFLFGRLEAIDPPTEQCGVLGGKFVSGHFSNSGIDNGKTTIGFVAGCQGVLVAARATVNWTATNNTGIIEPEEEEEEEQPIVCTDSDGGKNLYTKGTTSGKYGTVAGSSTYNDYCLSDNQLVEYYCSGSNVLFRTYSCSDSCASGACVLVVEEEEEIIVEPEVEILYCTDSDGGDDLATKGTTSGKYGTVPGLSSFDDYCASDSRLVEYYCIGASVQYGVYNCSGSCLNGVCIESEEEEEEPISCTDTEGLDEFVKGYSSGTMYTGRIVEDAEDYCQAYDVSGHAEVSECTSGDCRITQWMCSSSDVLLVDYNSRCPHGCRDGACLPRPDDVVMLPCSDTDGGNGFYEKGTTVGWFQSNPGRESKTDYCQNETNLVEYTCVDDYYVWDIIRRCANGCSEGACIE